MEAEEEPSYKSPSYLLVHRQLQDLLKRREITVPHEDHQAVIAQLDEEKLEHMKTKAKLAEMTEKLQFAQGEIEMMKNQLDREKKTFENAFQKLKSKAVVESERNDELYNKCLEMEEICVEKDDGLTFQDTKIKDLRSRISKQKQTHKHMLETLDLELKQEQYVARQLLNNNNALSKSGGQRSQFRRKRSQK